MRLTSNAIDTYRDRGYLIPPYRLEPDLLQSLQQALDQLIRDNPGVRPEKLVSAHIEGQNDEGVKGSRRFLALAMHPPIVDMVEQLIGPDVILWGCHVFCKPAAEGFETPWHQGRPLLADPSAGHLYRLGGAGAQHPRERLPARHSGFTPGPGPASPSA